MRRLILLSAFVVLLSGCSSTGGKSQEQIAQDTTEMDAAMAGNTAALPGSYCDRNPSSVSCRNQKSDNRITPKFTPKNISDRPCLSDIAECPNDTQKTSNDALPYELAEAEKEDYAIAFKLLEQLAEKGDADSQYQLGVLYANKTFPNDISFARNVDKSYQIAASWYRKAAIQGHADAQNALGLIHSPGSNGFVNAPLGPVFCNLDCNAKEAEKWYRKAADQGHADAQNNLGLMYTLYGSVFGYHKSDLLGYMWFNIGDGNGSNKARINRDMVAKRMTPAQISKAEGMAQDCLMNKSCEIPIVTAKIVPIVPHISDRPCLSDIAECPNTILSPNDGAEEIVPKQTRRKKIDPDKVISASSGSGFAVSKNGYVVTNNHVIDGCQNVKIHYRGKSILATVVTYDTQNDLALLKGDFRPSAVFSLSSGTPELLQDIYVAGYPFGHKFGTGVKVTKGIISSLTGIGNNFSQIQIDAALQPGNSGGPILDDKGNVVGVAVAKLDSKYVLETYGMLPENTNFGIKTSVVRNILVSSGVSLPSANPSSISKSKLGKMISDGTYYLSCWMTMAQIEKFRSRKVIFQNLN